MLLLLVSALLASPVELRAGKPSPVPAPLGLVGDVVGPLPVGGVPAEEKALVLELPGCDRRQVINLTRFLAGARLAGSQLQAWLELKGQGAPSGLERQLFGKRRRLIETVAKASRALPVEQAACEEPLTADGWKLQLVRAPRKACRPGDGPLGAYWFSTGAGAQPLAAAVYVAAAPKDAADRCRPRLSAALFDEQGVARLRYHADFGGVLQAELLGDGCQAVAFVFEPQQNVFRAHKLRAKAGCKAP